MIETIFNGSEAALWFSFAVIVIVRYRRAEPRLLRLSRLMAVFFVLFGISDIIEIQTGAWWRPPGLLMLKAACLAGLTWCFVLLMRSAK